MRHIFGQFYSHHKQILIELISNRFDQLDSAFGLFGLTKFSTLGKFNFNIQYYFDH